MQTDGTLKKVMTIRWRVNHKTTIVDFGYKFKKIDRTLWGAGDGCASASIGHIWFRPDLDLLTSISLHICPQMHKNCKHSEIS